MGAEEILTVIVASGGLTALMRSLSLWIKYRQPKLHVSVTSPGGKTVVVDSVNAGDVESVLKAIREQ
jgi:threonine dehydratase